MVSSDGGQGVPADRAGDGRRAEGAGSGPGTPPYRRSGAWSVAGRGRQLVAVGGARLRTVTAASSRLSRRGKLLAVLTVVLVLAGAGVVAGLYYVDSVPTPAQLELPQATTVYYADGKTPMARLGAQNRTILSFDEMNDAVKQSVVAAEDQTFWTNKGIDFGSVLRAAWHNLTGGRAGGGGAHPPHNAPPRAPPQRRTESREGRA